MEMEINAKITSKETIKPSSPTPAYLRNFKLCLIDQLSPATYGPLVFFYSMDHHNLTAIDISRQLKTSLSQALTQFYPLAGRIKEEAGLIECNDDGAVFVEAQANCLLSKFLEKPDTQVIRKFLPIAIESSEAGTGNIVHVQVTYFGCGGVAIGVCVSHKIADAMTITRFIQNWAATSLGSGEVILPLFGAASVFPPHNFSITKSKPALKLSAQKVVTKRFVFQGSKIASLQAKASSERVKNPTRVEAVTALIWRCAMNAARSNIDHLRLSILSQSVNIRKRITPPLPEHTVGNLVGHFASQATEPDMELHDLVYELRKGIKDFGQNYAKKLQGENAFQAICESFQQAAELLRGGNVDFYISTSLCRFPLYEIDFGWGKPMWVTIPSAAFKNVVSMLDTKDGDGIDACVTLTEDWMDFFERDQELLAVASLNPSAVSKPLINPNSCL